MKKTALSFFLAIGLLPFAKSQSVGDSTEFPTFKQNYNAHAAFVSGNQWTTSLGNQHMGARWQHVADEFDVSPEGKEAYLLGQQIRGRAPLYLIGGYAMLLGSLPLLLSPNNSPNVSLEGGIGIGMALGGFALTLVGSRKMMTSADNFERALWLRNRDEMLRYLPLADQSRFKYLYDTETMYLNARAYYKNGNRYSLGLFGTNGSEEFRNIPASWDRYKKYRNSLLIGAAVQVAGMAAVLLSPGLDTSRGRLLYFGGAIVMGAGSGISISGRRFLSEAVYLKNYNVLERQMLLR